MNVIVTGSLGYDFIMDYSGRFADRIMPEKIHKLSLSFLVDTLNKQFGGTSGNIAYTLKLLGIEPLIVSAAGNDFSPYKIFFKKHKIATTYIKEYKDIATGSYFVVTDQEDNQIGSFYSGATKYAKTLSIRQVKETVDLVAIAPTESVAMNAYVKECRQAKLPYLYDPAFQIAQCTPEELKEGITNAKILVGNDYEISLIEQKLEISHEELRVMVPIVITTLGSKGSIIETRKESIHIRPAKPKNTTDPTGAGDAFRAGFIAGYLRAVNWRPALELTGHDLLICGQMGSTAAVYTVETYGTQTHTFAKKEFAKRYRENFGSSLSL